MTREEREKAIKEFQKIVELAEWVDRSTADIVSVDLIKCAIEALQNEQNAYKEGYDACKRIMAREKQFNSYCPICMSKLETLDDVISRTDLIKHITKDRDKYDVDKNYGRELWERYCVYNTVISDIEKFPSVNAKTNQMAKNNDNESTVTGKLISKQDVLNTIDSYIENDMGGLLGLKLFIIGLPSVNAVYCKNAISRQMVLDLLKFLRNKNVSVYEYDKWILGLPLVNAINNQEEK